MSFFEDAKNALDTFTSDIKKMINETTDEGEKGEAAVSSEAHGSSSLNRFGSFAPARHGSEAKWFVDGCSYMWVCTLVTCYHLPFLQSCPA